MTRRLTGSWPLVETGRPMLAEGLHDGPPEPQRCLGTSYIFNAGSLSLQCGEQMRGLLAGGPIVVIATASTWR
jgi:hypothetical protein